MRLRSRLTLLGVAFFLLGTSAQAGTWLPSTGTAQWLNSGSWVGGTIANGVGDTATFNKPSGPRNMDLNGQFTVGSLTFNNVGTNSSTQNIRNVNANNLLTFDENGSGPATITSSGNSATNSRMQSDMWFEDNVVVNVSNTVGDPTAGALSITGNIHGPGGLTKTGDGQLTMAVNEGVLPTDPNAQVKAYSGPTNVNGGRYRTSWGGTLGMLTSSFTINGGQMSIINTTSAPQTFTFGPGPLNLNGFGPTSGPYAQYGGAIRPDTNTVSTITNNVVLQSDASVFPFGTFTYLTLSGIISGPGRFYLDGTAGQPTNHGTLIVTNANSYGGGTSIIQGTLELIGSNATLGSGDVLVDGVSDRGNGILGTGRLDIEADVANAIADSATVTLTGGIYGGWATLGSGVDDLIGGLVLGGVAQTVNGTYGSSLSNAEYKSDQYFQGTGVLRLLSVPEPTTLPMASVILPFLLLAFRSRKR